MLQFEWHPEPLVVAEEVDILAAELNNMRVPLEASLLPVMKAVEQRFESEGPGWEVWAESYSEYAQSHNVGGILWQTGALVEGATHPGSYLVTDHEIIWTGGEAPSYWAFHQDGTSKMPARPFLGTDSAAEDEIVGIFAVWLEGAMMASGVTRSSAGLHGPGGQFISHPLSGFGIR